MKRILNISDILFEVGWSTKIEQRGYIISTGLFFEKLTEIPTHSWFDGLLQIMGDFPEKPSLSVTNPLYLIIVT